MSEKKVDISLIFQKLIEYEFAIYKSKSKTWQCAAIGENKNNVLCVLIRKGGIDYRIYNKKEFTGISIESNVAIMNGGDIYRNYYYKSDVSLFSKTIDIIQFFKKDKIRSTIYKQDGKSNKERPNYNEVKASMAQRYSKIWEDKVERRIQSRNDAIAMSHGWSSE